MEEAQAENKSYLSARDSLETQDPDELMITDECKDSENIKQDVKDNESSDVKVGTYQYRYWCLVEILGVFAYNLQSCRLFLGFLRKDPRAPVT